MSSKKYIISTIVIFTVGVLYLMYISQPQEIVERSACPVHEKESVVRGDSMKTLLKNGETITALYGYYACHEIKRGDIVLYNYAGDTVPIIKKIAAVPGDSFSLEKNANGWSIFVNGIAYKNFEGREYVLNQDSKRMLQLYETDYHGIIPKDAYLLLGDNIDDSIDSRRFGLVGGQDILAKVMLN